MVWRWAGPSLASGSPWPLCCIFVRLRTHDARFHHRFSGRRGGCMANLQALSIAAILLLSVSQHAEAARIKMSQFPPNPGLMPGGGWKFTPGSTFADPPPPRQWVDGVYGGVRAVIASDAITLSGRAGALVVTAAQAVTVAEAAAVVARCLANPVCIAATAAAGAAAAALYDHYRVKPAPGGGLEADDGQAEVDTSMYQCKPGSFKSSATTSYTQPPHH